MNMLSKQALLTRFKNHPTYSTQFKKIYGNNIGAKNLVFSNSAILFVIAK
jgi:uncharacterized membrane protein